jgi:hypothetical protein
MRSGGTALHSLITWVPRHAHGSNSAALVHREDNELIKKKLIFK